MTQTIKAIETSYAGCRFRSRLEARWAVFFDTAGIKWQYEPQGYVLGHIPYLPDFWLPELGVWVEVKGHFRAAGDDRPIDDWTLMQWAARPGGLAPELGADATGWPEILILGEIPSLDYRPKAHGGPDLPPVFHTLLTPMMVCRAGGLSGVASGHGFQVEPIIGLASVEFRDRSLDNSQWPSLYPAGLLDLNAAQHMLSVKPREGTASRDMDDVTALAYSAARAARFEHGERG